MFDVRCFAGEGNSMYVEEMQKPIQTKPNQTNQPKKKKNKKKKKKEEEEEEEMKQNKNPIRTQLVRVVVQVFSLSIQETKLR